MNQWLKRHFEERMHGNSAHVHRSNAGWCKHYKAFARVCANIFQKRAFASSCLASEENRLIGVIY